METLQESIAKMNADSVNISEPVPMGTAPVIKTPEPPAGGGEPPKPEPTKTPSSAQPLNPDKKPPETSVIEKKDPPTPAPGAEATPPGGEPPKPAAIASPEAVLGETLSALTEGHLKTKDDLVGLINHYNELVTQAEEGFKPKFKDERTRKAHQILADAGQGTEMATAMRTLRALNFNPEGKTPKDVLFEAFLLDPKNSDLSESRANRLFEEEYNEKYGDIEGNDRKTRNLELEVKEAKAMIDKIQTDFKVVDEEPARISKEVETSIQKVASEFGGIRIAFTDNPTEMDYLNVPVDDPKVLASLQEIALNPQAASDRFISQFATKNGFDYPAYYQALYEREHAAELRQKAYDHGFIKGQLAKVNEAANASTKKDISAAGTPVPDGAPKSLAEAFGNALSKQGR
jgi:hypothetical protein